MRAGVKMPDSSWALSLAVQSGPVASDDRTTILAEFRAELNDIAGTHNAALTGLRLYRESLMKHLADAPNPDANLLIGHGDPNEQGSLAYQRWPIRSIPKLLADDGPVAERLGQQWVVLIFTQWEHNYRPRLAQALGSKPEEIQDAYMGDIRHLRNDILHHAGIATQANTGRCLSLCWFQAGDRIVITTNHVAEFMHHCGLTIRP